MTLKTSAYKLANEVGFGIGIERYKGHFTIWWVFANRAGFISR